MRGGKPAMGQAQGWHMAGSVAAHPQEGMRSWGIWLLLGRRDPQGGWGGLAGDSRSPLQNASLTLSKKLKLMRDNLDLLELCHTVPMEVIATGE